MRDFDWYAYQEIKSEQETDDDDLREVRESAKTIGKILRPVLGVGECKLAMLKERGRVRE